MGNKTSLDLSLLEKSAVEPIDKICFRVGLDKSICDLEYIYVSARRGKLTLSAEEPDNIKIINFEPQTHMRDFYVILEGNRDGSTKRLARGQMVCVIIFGHLYLSLAYKEKQYFPRPADYFPIETVEYCMWDPTKISNLDAAVSQLSLGLDLLFLRHEEAEPVRFCEPLDQRDERRTPIIFSGLNSMAVFKPRIFKTSVVRHKNPAKIVFEDD